MDNIIWQWRRWEVTMIEEEWIKYAIKKYLSDETKAAINKESQIIEKINNEWLNFVPKIVDKWDWWFKYYYIEWEDFNDVYDTSEDNVKNKLILELLERCYDLDKIWVVHWELHRPFSNVLVNEKFKVFIIDFDRWWFWEFNWKNLRSYAQWLKNKDYLSIDDVRVIWQLQELDLIYKFIYDKLSKLYEQEQSEN